MRAREEAGLRDFEAADFDEEVRLLAGRLADVFLDAAAFGLRRVAVTVRKRYQRPASVPGRVGVDPIVLDRLRTGGQSVSRSGNRRTPRR